MSRMPLTPRSLQFYCGFVLLCVLPVVTGVGCSGGSGNTVSGKVTLNDKPVAGVVVFVGADLKEVSAPTGVDGGYRMTELAKGEYAVIVKPLPGAGSRVAPPPKDVPAPKVGPATVQGELPPAKYAVAVTSNLKVTVTGGRQTYDIPLTP